MTRLAICCASCAQSLPTTLRPPTAASATRLYTRHWRRSSATCINTSIWKTTFSFRAPWRWNPPSIRCRDLSKDADCHPWLSFMKHSLAEDRLEEDHRSLTDLIVQLCAAL